MSLSLKWKVLVVFCFLTAYICVFTGISHRQLSRSTGQDESVPGENKNQAPQNPMPERSAANFPSPILSARFPPFRVHPRAIKTPQCLPLKFSPIALPRTALASFPGSGNTWLRYLIQQATGIYTGSIYKDVALLRNGFPGESISNESVILVKTHEWGEKARQNFARTLLLVRDPYASILAEFNRQYGGHVGYARPEKYKQVKDKQSKRPVWKEFVEGKSQSWTNTILDWLKFDGPLLILHYEDVVTDPRWELQRIFDFLNITVPSKIMDCVMMNKDGIFKRKKRQLPFDPFDQKMKGYIDIYKQTVTLGIQLVQNNCFNRNNTTLNQLWKGS